MAHKCLFSETRGAITSARFTGKVALVTGAASGIGEAIARRLHADGATVIIADVSEARGEIAESLGERAIARRLNVADEADVRATEEWIMAEYGKLNILANNAGIGGAQALTHEYPVGEFDKVMAVNVRGQFLVLQAGLRLMLANGGGAIVNTASVGGFRATPTSIAYIASKGADVMLTRTAALEYAQKGIRVNAVGPGTIATPILSNSPQSFVEMLESQVPQGRLGRAEEVANVVAFLADDDQASHVTGQVWLVDGGRSAG
jgi:NAD(P)-dependent dehydrogenase (short-subunit alcohol dehydrogenase family)